MKQLIYILLISISAFAQQPQIANFKSIYIDGVRFDTDKITIDEQNILDRKTEPSVIPGMNDVHITRKDKRKIIPLSVLVNEIQEASDTLKNRKDVNVFVDDRLVAAQKYFIEKEVVTEISVSQIYIYGDRLLSAPAISFTTNNNVHDIYIDDIKFNWLKIYLNSKNIEHAEVKYTDENSINICNRGRKSITYITRKKKDKLIPLSEIISSAKISNKIPENETVNLVIDDILILNPDGYFIEQNFIKKMAVLKSDPKLKGDHLYRQPTVIITTKAKNKKH